MNGTGRVNRRRFLGGAGVAIGLPFLPSLAPRGAAAAPKAPLRFIGFFIPNGVNHAQWDPPTTGPAWSSASLEPLNPVRDQVLVLTGLSKASANHKPGTGCFLTEKIVRTNPGPIIGADRNDISLDQYLAQRLGQETVLRSLELGAESGKLTGQCDSSDGLIDCSYTSAIAWAGPSRPLPKITDPKVAFDRLFQGFDPAATREQQTYRTALKKSVLDYSLDEAKRLRARLGSEDRPKLDEYLGGVADLETQILRAAQGGANGATCGGVTAPVPTVNQARRAELLVDVLVLAMKCDRTRFATFMLGDAGSTRSLSVVGQTGSHHPVSHHGGLPENLQKLALMDRWEVSLFARLLQGLKAVTDVDGRTVLDNTAAVLSSDISDGDKHDGVNVPLLVGGKLGGYLRTGRHAKYTGKKVGHLFVSILQGFGLPVTQFGDTGNGPLPDLVA